MMILMIILELRIILQNISRKVVGNVLNNISPSNIFPTLHLSESYRKSVRFVLAAVSINGLIKDTI